MERNKYQKKYKDLSLSKTQVSELSNYIEDKLMIANNSVFVKNFELERELDGLSNFANNLFFYIIGEADTKDIFFDLEEEVVSVILIKDINIDDKYKDNIMRFAEELKNTLTEDQYPLLKMSLEQLYVRPRNFVENKYYFKNNYQKSLISAEKYLLSIL